MADEPIPQEPQAPEPEPQPTPEPTPEPTQAEPYWTGDLGGQHVELTKEDVGTVVNRYYAALEAAQKQPAAAPAPAESPPQKNALLGSTDETANSVMEKLDGLSTKLQAFEDRYQKAETDRQTQNVMQAYEQEMVSQPFFKALKESSPDDFRKAMRYAMIEQSGDPNMSRQTAIKNSHDFLAGVAEKAKESFVTNKVRAAQAATPASGGASPTSAVEGGGLKGEDFVSGKTEELAMKILNERLG